MRTLLAVGAVAALSLSTLAFHDTPVGAIDADAVRDGDAVTFEGYANLATPEPGHIPGEFFATEFADPQVADALGLDLTDAYLEELADGSGLRFTWQMASSLPADGLPEAVRYNWAFQAGDQTFQLQVKRSNLANATTAEAPVDHVNEAAEGDWWFQLRGACTANYLNENNPVQGCYHLGFFDGDVDLDAGTVSMELPYEASDAIGRLVAGTFRRGVPIVEAASASMSIAASGQAVISNTSTSQYINGWGTYYPGTVVSAALGTASTPGSFTLVETPGDGTFAGTLTGDGDHLWVRACTGYGIEGLTADPCTEVSFPIG